MTSGTLLILTGKLTSDCFIPKNPPKTVIGNEQNIHKSINTKRMLRLKIAEESQYIKKKFTHITMVKINTGKNKLVIIRLNIQLGLGKSGFIIVCG